MSGETNLNELIRIEQLINDYGYAVDAPDFGVLASCFTQDAVFEVNLPGVYDKRLDGYASIEAHVRALHSTFATHRHVITNHLYTVEGESASGQSVFTAYHWSDGKRSMTVGGLYVDKLVKADQSWRISYRNVIVDWQEGAEGQYDKMAEEPSSS